MQAELFSAGRIKGLATASRLVLSPMSRMQAHADGTPSAAMAGYYAGYARSGVGLVITEATFTDEAASRAYFHQPGMANERHLAAWRRVVDAVHAQGTPIFLQLQHGGRLAEPGLHAVALGASGIEASGISWQQRLPYSGAPLRKASADDIDRMVRAFGDAARRARAAGFDGVEIHGARGYLLDEFLSRPGAALEARLETPLRVVQAVRDAFPGLLSFNFSLYKMDDAAYQPPGGADEVRAIVQALSAQGLDAFHVSTRNLQRAEAFGAPLARVVRDALPGLPLILNGGVRTLDDAQNALQASGGGFVALARALLANPDWVSRVRRGEPLRAYAPGMERLPLLQPG